MRNQIEAPKITNKNMFLPLLLVTLPILEEDFFSKGKTEKVNIKEQRVWNKNSNQFSSIQNILLFSGHTSSVKPLVHF